MTDEELFTYFDAYPPKDDPRYIYHVDAEKLYRLIALARKGAAVPPKGYMYMLVKRDELETSSFNTEQPHD